MPSFKLNPDHIMEAVYSYPFPEVRSLLNSIRLPAEFMLNTLPVEQAQTYLKGYKFNPKLELVSTPDGSLDLDELHVPIIRRIKKQLLPLLPGLDNFTDVYPTPGSSQAIFTLMAEWKAKGDLKSIAILEGEYEGYAAYAACLNIPVTIRKTLLGHAPKEGEVWFVSNPSAIDGNFIDSNIWDTFVHTGHQIVYDAAYIGLVSKGSVDVSSPNIKAITVSPSKVFGVFRYRLTGLCFTRKPVSSLYGTKWFKDIPALLDTLKLYETFKSYELSYKYTKAQKDICTALGKIAGGAITPSDTLLLAFSSKTVDTQFQKYARNKDVYRFGLTKLFEDYEKYGSAP